MSKNDLRSKQERKRKCVECNRFALLNNEEICGKCKEERKKDADSRCGVCRMPVRKNDNGMECETCSVWFHAGCASVTQDQYRAIENEESPWSCGNCEMKARIRNLTNESRNEVLQQPQMAYILCDGCGSERRADEFVDCTVCLVKSENLALKLQIKECREGMEQMQKVFSMKMMEMQENINKLREDLSVRKKVREEQEPAKTPNESIRKGQVEPQPTKTLREVIAVPTSNKFRLLQDQQEEKKPEKTNGETQKTGKPRPINTEHEGVKKQTPRIIVGDSMVRHMRKHVKLEAEGSKNISLSGRPLKEILQEAKTQAMGTKKGLLIIQGGGNDLMVRSAAEATKLILETVKEIKKGKNNLRVGVVGILRRPRDSLAYKLEEGR